MSLDYASHRRLPSIQNILSAPPQDLPPRDQPRDFSRPQYNPDPFRPATSSATAFHPPTPQYHPQSPPAAAGKDAQPQSLPSLITRPTAISLAGEEPTRYGPVNAPSVSSYPPSLTHSGPTSPNSVARPSDPYHTSPSSIEARSQNGSPPSHLDTASSGHASPKPARGPQVRFVDGHGKCYIMPDGTFMPCQINGDPVNPEFGVTKAGKPRKRLAQACMTCREKKIKCQPGEPKCQQCTKLNRECKRPTAQQVIHTKDSTSAELPVQSVSVAPRFEFHAKAASPPLLTKKRVTADAITEHPIAAYTKPPMAEEAMPKGPKRQRSSGFDPVYSDNGFNRFDQHPPMHMPVPGLAPGFDQMGMDFAEDPFEREPYLAVEFLDLYFRHRGRGLYGVFPQEAFMEWVVTCKNKRRDEKMLLYIVMAVGSRFCKDRKKKNIGTKYAKKAAFMERESLGENTLQLAQTRLYFLLYCFANGDNAMGWDYLCSGMGTCNALGLNTEEGVNDVGDDSSMYDYGFTRYQLTECRRRTFFAGYCMDRYIGHNSGHSCLVHDDDVFLRLPGREEALRKGDEAQAGPYFSEGQICEPFTEAPGEMAALIPIVSIWGGVVAHAWRSLHRPSQQGYLNRYEEHYAKTYRKVAAWEDTLPEKLRFTAQNTAAAIQNGCASPYFVLHSIRFVALIKLNRNANVQLLPVELQSHNISRANLEAHNLLSITTMLSRNMHLFGESVDFDNALSQPFPGYATLAACEVISAGGYLQNRALIKQVLSEAAVVVENIGRFWFAGSKQQAKIDKLVRRIESQEHDFGTGPHHGLWKLPTTQDARDFFPEHYDLINASPKEIFYEAVMRV